jgi:hypothetical protein
LTAPSSSNPRVRKAGRGLGKGGAKRHRKILPDAVENEEAEDDDADDSDEEMGFALFDGGYAYPTKKELAKPEERPLLQRLIEKQTFEGSWELETLSWDSLSVKKDEADKIVDEVAKRHSDLDREKLSTVVATALIIALFEKDMSEDEETWELVAEKARAWLGEAADKNVLDGVLEEIDALFA